MFSFFKNRRRQKLRSLPFPAEWEAALGETMPLFARLPPGDQQSLRELIQVFLAEKRFEGCGGLEMDDTIRVTVAAQACLLLLHLPEPDMFPRLKSVLVYPESYFAESLTPGPDGHVHESESHRLGESWSTGSVVLSWNAVEQGSLNTEDGQNVVFHEFAHQLDQENSASQGAPYLAPDLGAKARRSKYVSWARVMREEFEHLQFQEKHGENTLLDTYGATNPAEFFAVATETFFERPETLSEKHPDLYAELKSYYRQDPRTW
jgi:Mlc titration factor MtfA (ptsG expression regulator)